MKVFNKYESKKGERRENTNKQRKKNNLALTEISFGDTNVINL